MLNKRERLIVSALLEASTAVVLIALAAGFFAAFYPF